MTAQNIAPRHLTEFSGNQGCLLRTLANFSSKHQRSGKQLLWIVETELFFQRPFFCTAMFGGQVVDCFGMAGFGKMRLVFWLWVPTRISWNGILEWSFLGSEKTGSSGMAYNHEAPVLCCGFSKDGQRIFSGGCDNKAGQRHPPLARTAELDPSPHSEIKLKRCPRRFFLAMFCFLFSLGCVPKKRGIKIAGYNAVLVLVRGTYMKGMPETRLEVRRLDGKISTRWVWWWLSCIINFCLYKLLIKTSIPNYKHNKQYSVSSWLLLCICICYMLLLVFLSMLYCYVFITRSCLSPALFLYGRTVGRWRWRSCKHSKNNRLAHGPQKGSHNLVDFFNLLKHKKHGIFSWNIPLGTPPQSTVWEFGNFLNHLGV